MELPSGWSTPDVEIELYGSGLLEVDQRKLKSLITKKVGRISGRRTSLQVTVTVQDPRKEKMQIQHDEKRRELDDDGSQDQGKEQREKHDRIFQQWRTIRPSHWGAGKYDGERKMLAEILGNDENIECLIGGSFGPHLGHSSWRDGANTLHNGVGIATNKRILFLDKGLFLSKEVAELPYKSIEAITYSSGVMFAGIRITGRGSLSMRMENINKREPKPFVDCVRKHLDAPETVAVAAAPSRISELKDLAELLKEGLVTQEEFDAAKARILGGD